MKAHRYLTLFAFALGAMAVFACALLAPSTAEAGAWLAFGALGMGFLNTDLQLTKTRALPASASATVDGAAIDLGHGAFGDFLADAELKLSAPATNATMTPDTRTMTYSIIHSDNSDLSAPSVLYSSVLVQTGAGGAGAAAATVTVRLPVDVKRYVGVRIVSGASTADASAVAATLQLLT